MRRGSAIGLIASAALIAAWQPANASPPRDSSGPEGCVEPLGWGLTARLGEGERVKNRVSIDSAGAIHWNGMPIDPVTLRQYMDVVATMSPTPHTAVEVDPGSPCARVLDVVKIIDRAVECSSVCSYARGPFDREPPPPPRR